MSQSVAALKLQVVGRRHLSTQSSKLRSAFTLIELLVVTAIIALLASLLLPTLSRAKSASLSTRCKSNLRQIGIGLALYVDEFRAYPKTRGPWGPGAVTYRAWVPLVTPYAGSIPMADRRMTGIFACPSPEGTRYSSGGQTFSIKPTYGYNHDGYQNDASAAKFRGLGGSSLPLPTGESEVIHPSGMIAIGDDAMNGPNNSVAASDIGFIRADNLSWGSDFSASIFRAQKRHRGRANIVFCDGHVDIFTLKALFLDRTDEALRRWNKDNEPHRVRP